MRWESLGTIWEAGCDTGCKLSIMVAPASLVLIVRIKCSNTLEVNEEKSWYIVSARVLSGDCVLSLPLQLPLPPGQRKGKTKLAYGGGARTGKAFSEKDTFKLRLPPEQTLEIEEHSTPKDAEWRWESGCKRGRGQDVASLRLLGSSSSLGMWIAELT